MVIIRIGSERKYGCDCSMGWCKHPIKFSGSNFVPYMQILILFFQQVYHTLKVLPGELPPLLNTVKEEWQDSDEPMEADDNLEISRHQLDQRRYALERVRTLCELVKKRERRKKEIVRFLWLIFNYLSLFLVANHEVSRY